MRDGALISLRVKHVDPARLRVIQNPKEVATKASKRIDTFFFPVSDTCEQIVVEWLRYLREALLFSDDDPLFPKPLSAWMPITVLLGIYMRDPTLPPPSLPDIFGALDVAGEMAIIRGVYLLDPHS